MADEQDEPRQFLAALKRIFKAQGLRYADIAGRIGVSEGTVKRYLNKKGLTLDVLSQLCKAADVTLSELARLTEEENPKTPPATTPAQEEILARDIILSMTFFLLTRGWRSERIARELELDDVALTGCLTRLDRLGVIALFPNNRVRLLRTFARNPAPNSATYALMARRVHELFDHINLEDPSVAWTNGFARLSEASLSQISRQLDGLRDEIFELGEADLHLPTDRVKWCAIFAAVRPVSIDTLLHENR
jgi:transcriptional regulator with XRE-family HTH domain